MPTTSRTRSSTRILAATAAVTVLSMTVLAAPSGAGTVEPARQPDIAWGDPSRVTAEERAFLLRAARNGITEIFQGVVAQARSNDPEVRTYGHHMVRDHFTQIANQLGIHLFYGVPVPSPDVEQQRVTAQLAEGVPAEGFDVLYLTVQVRVHEAALADVTAAAATAPNPFVRAFAASQVPVLSTHLATARQLLAERAGTSPVPVPGPVPVPTPAPVPVPMPPTDPMS
jgi:putative membrane protein